eukprot:g8601.t1
MRAASSSASPEPEVETTVAQAGQLGGSDVRPDDERYLMRAERKRRRKLARQARVQNVGRAKSVRRAGSSTEMVGLEALHPPQGPPGSGAPALSGLPDLSKPFTVLGIETSCDDTAAAVVRSDGAVLGEAIAGQAEVHEEWGGVVPGLARDSHALKMDGVVDRALEQAGLASAAEVDAVAVTVGPGLEICLRVGTEKAKALAAQHGKPFVAVHHLEAHALLARKGFTPAPAADVTASSAPGSSFDLGPSVPSSADDVAAAAAAASAAPSSESFAAAFTAAVTDVSIPSAASAGATPDSDPGPRGASSTSGVSAAATAAASAPSSEAFAAAFTAAVADVSASVASSAPAVPGTPSEPTDATTAGSEDGAGSVDEVPPPLEFPFLALLVSGGHCQLLLCEGVGLYTILGGTVDDALGEAYDKAARLLGLRVGGGGGPAVEALALNGDPSAVPLAVPMQSRKDLDFSFAGLKNSFRMAVTRVVEEKEKEARKYQGGAEANVATAAGETGDGDKISPAASMEKRGAALPESTRADLAASFQHTAIQHLEERVRRAMDSCEAMVATVPSAPPARSPPGTSSGQGTPPKELPSGFGEAEFARPYGGEFGEAEFQRASAGFGENEFRRGSAGLGESFGEAEFMAPGGLEEGGGRSNKPEPQGQLAGREAQGGEKAKGVRALAVVGGVAANKELRRRLQALCDERKPAPWQMVVPPARLCTDNGVMVAWAAVERLREGMSNDPERQEVYARLPLGRLAGDAATAAAIDGGGRAADTSSV